MIVNCLFMYCEYHVVTYINKVYVVTIPSLIFVFNLTSIFKSVYMKGFPYSYKY